MTIHHDKMAYGKLDPLQEELSRDKLNDIADLLNAEEAAQESETAAEESETSAEESETSAQESETAAEEGGVAARTEREKMLAGELYDPSDAELTALRTRVRKLARAFNDTDEEDEEGRQALLRAIFGSCGEDIHCEPPLRFDYGAHTSRCASITARTRRSASTFLPILTSSCSTARPSRSVGSAFSAPT